MSAVGGLIARVVTALGGPQVAAGVVVAGLVVGGVGGGLVAAGGSSGGPATSSGQLPVYPCPNQGPALATVAGGQQLLVTGRLADGSWLRIHLPAPGRDEGWIQASPVTVKGSVDALPVATCAPVVAPAAPAVEPFPSLTAIVNATPSPGPTGTPAPTANARPSMTALAASTGKISYDTGSYCPSAVKKVTFTVKASDASGISGVTLYWREPGASTYAQSPMSQASGSSTSGTWQVTLDTTANGITKAGTLAYYAVGTDTSGATGKTPASGASSLAVAVCANAGPTITQAASSSGSTLYWVPTGAAGNCQTATDITAAVNDPDGVKSVTLYFRRPGSSTWSPKAMNNTTIAGKWYANIDTLGDGIKKTGTLSWYIKAIDGKNAAGQTKTASISVRQCDSPAVITVSATSKQLCFSTSTIFYATAKDADGLSTTSAVLVYSYKLTNGSSRTARVPMTYTDQNGSGTFFYNHYMTAGSGWALTTMKWYVQTTDIFGGVSKSAMQAITVAKC